MRCTGSWNGTAGPANKGIERLLPHAAAAPSAPSCQYRTVGTVCTYSSYMYTVCTVRDQTDSPGSRTPRAHRFAHRTKHQNWPAEKTGAASPCNVLLAADPTKAGRNFYRILSALPDLDARGCGCREVPYRLYRCGLCCVQTVQSEARSSASGRRGPCWVTGSRTQKCSGGMGMGMAWAWLLLRMDGREHLTEVWPGTKGTPRQNGFTGSHSGGCARRNVMMLGSPRVAVVWERVCPTYVLH